MSKAEASLQQAESVQGMVGLCRRGRSGAFQNYEDLTELHGEGLESLGLGIRWVTQLHHLVA